MLITILICAKTKWLCNVCEKPLKKKHELSSSTETDINLPFICADATGPKHLTTSLTRDQLEELVIDLIDRTLEPCQMALDDAGVAKDTIHEVLLVGGMTRMPKVQERVEEFFNKQPNQEINPDEVVSVGAAIQGGVLSGDVKDVLLLDVTPLTLGVETAGGVLTGMIPRNTTIPTKKSTVFSTAVDNQPMVSVHVLQGERPMAEDNKTLARFELVGIPPAPRGVPQIEVTFEIDANGIVHVAAKDLGTGKNNLYALCPRRGSLRRKSWPLSMMRRMPGQRMRGKRELADLRNNADGLIYTTEKSLDEYGHALEEQDIEDIQAFLQGCKEAMDGDDVDVLRDAIASLETTSYKIAEAMYAEAAEAEG